MEVEVNRIEVGHLHENCYLIKYGNEAWLIDPGENAAQIINAFNLDELELQGIINTHGHFDHTGAVAEIQQRYNLHFYLHSKDKRLLHQGNLYRKLSGSNTITPTPVINKQLDEITKLDLGDKTIKIYHTPGHTPGSVCFAIDNNLFTGDVILEGEHGRTDLPGGNKESQQNSVDFIKKNFAGYTIYPGHGQAFLLDDYITSNQAQHGIEHKAY